MAFDIKNLAAMAYANGFTLWHYKTTDTVADVNTAGYFNTASDMLRVNDMIVGVTATGGTPAAAFFLVNANASGVVDVTDGLAVGTTDTD